ncbi:MAG TPA: hypothetical protein VI233_11040 [Puia sp.]
MDIQFRTYPILSPLRGYIQKIWVFESSNKLNVAGTHRIALVGMSDSPSIVDAEKNAPVGIAGVEFSPMGAYRFFHFNLKDIANKLYSLTDLLSKTAKEMEDKLQEQPDIESLLGRIS